MFVIALLDLASVVASVIAWALDIDLVGVLAVDRLVDLELHCDFVGVHHILAVVSL